MVNLRLVNWMMEEDCFHSLLIDQMGFHLINQATMVVVMEEGFHLQLVGQMGFHLINQVVIMEENF